MHALQPQGVDLRELLLSHGNVREPRSPPGAPSRNCHCSHAGRRQPQDAWPVDLRSPHLFVVDQPIAGPVAWSMPLVRQIAEGAEDLRATPASRCQGQQGRPAGDKRRSGHVTSHVGSLRALTELRVLADCGVLLLCQLGELSTILFVQAAELRVQTLKLLIALFLHRLVPLASKAIALHKREGEAVDPVPIGDNPALDRRLSVPLALGKLGHKPSVTILQCDALEEVGGIQLPGVAASQPVLRVGKVLVNMLRPHAQSHEGAGQHRLIAGLWPLPKRN
mmetsp:Transcript_62731/g.141657  ORF Transcript_62731/g.141657 Transcript_62731/m.141657 type:complete len:279 (-) Transcript_62731:75-911(-)